MKTEIYPKAMECTYGELKRICKRFGRDISDKSKCTKCGHAFTDDETPILAMKSEDAFICYKCFKIRGERDNNDE